MKTTLTPTQQRTYDALRRDLKVGHLLILSGDAGMGKTTLLRELYRRSPNAAWVHIGDFVAALRAHHPLALEEAFEQVVSEALRMYPPVYGIARRARRRLVHPAERRVDQTWHTAPLAVHLQQRGEGW